MADPITVVNCVRCAAGLAMPDFFSAPTERIGPALGGKALFRLASGALLLVVEAEAVLSYCPACGPQVRFCVVCGCTDEVGCEEGCSWRERTKKNGADVCSSCVPAGFVLLEEG